jgi:hypothetical protein
MRPQEIISRSPDIKIGPPKGPRAISRAWLLYYSTLDIPLSSPKIAAGAETPKRGRRPPPLGGAGETAPAPAAEARAPRHKIAAGRTPGMSADGRRHGRRRARATPREGARRRAETGPQTASGAATLKAARPPGPQAGCLGGPPRQFQIQCAGPRRARPAR